MWKLLAIEEKKAWVMVNAKAVGMKSFGLHYDMEISFIEIEGLGQSEFLKKLVQNLDVPLNKIGAGNPINFFLPIY